MSNLVYLITAHITLELLYMYQIFFFCHFHEWFPRAHQRQDLFNQTVGVDERSGHSGCRCAGEAVSRTNTGVCDLSAPCLLLLCTMSLSGHAGQFRTSHTHTHKGTHCIFRKSSRLSRVNRLLFDLLCQNENEQTAFYFGTRPRWTCPRL